MTDTPKDKGAPKIKTKRRRSRAKYAPSVLEIRDPDGRVRRYQQCVATAKSTQQRCRMPAILGAVVCPRHGGSTEAVRRNARERLAYSADSLMGELIKIAHDERHPVYARLQAIKDALDRAGFGAKHATAAAQADADDPWGALLGGVLGDSRDMSEFDDGSQLAIDANRMNEQQHAIDARERSWRELDREDDDAERGSRLPYDPDRPVVLGEVVKRGRAPADVPEHIRDGFDRTTGGR